MNKRLLFALMAMLCLSGAPAWADDTDVALRCALLLIKKRIIKKRFYRVSNRRSKEML